MKKRILLLTLLAAVSYFFALPSAFAGPLFTISPGPTYSSKFPTHGEFKYQMAPGETLSTEVTVSNIGSEEVRLSMYAVDASMDPIGAFLIKNVAQEQLGFGTWIDIPSMTEDFRGSDDRFDDDGGFVLYPRDKVVFPVTFTVPENFSPGPYFGSIIVAAAPDETALTATGSRLSTAVGVKFSIYVVGEEVFDVKWTGFSLADPESGDGKAFRVEYSNDGNMAVDIEMDLSVDSVFGGRLFEKKRSIRALPGVGGKDEAVWEDVPYIGFFKVSAASKYRKSDLFGTVEGDMEPTDLGVKELSFFVIPWLHVGIFALVVLLLVFFVMVRHRHHKRFAASLVQYKVKKGDTLFELASSRGADWKMIAKVNKLHPPYPLMSGQTVLVPGNKKS